MPELRRLGCPKLRPSRKWTPEYCSTKVAATDSKDFASGAQALMTMISCLDKPESSRSNSTLIGSDNSMLPSRVLRSFHHRRRLDTYDNIDSPFCRAKEPGFCPALKSSRASSLARGNTTSRSFLTNFRSPPGCVSTSTPMSRASSKASSLSPSNTFCTISVLAWVADADSSSRSSPSGRSLGPWLARLVTLGLLDLPCLLERLVSEGLSRLMAAASEAKSPPLGNSPGASTSASASVGSSWGVGLLREFLRLAFFWALALMASS